VLIVWHGVLLLEVSGCAATLPSRAPHFRLCSVFEISNLRIKRTLEGRPRGAAFDIGCEALVARDDVGVLEGSQHRRHHQIAGREAVAIEIWLARRSRTWPWAKSGTHLKAEIVIMWSARLRFLERGRSDAFGQAVPSYRRT
jgi:hypothetical protein